MYTKWLCPCLILFMCHVSSGQINNAPVFIRDMQDHLISEDTEVGTTVYTLNASDPEGVQVTYKIKADMFRIGHPSLGDVILVQNLDYELKTFYSVEVTATDQVNVVDRDITVYVDDVNDEIPVFTKTALDTVLKESVPVNSIVIPDISVTDVDLTNDILTVKCDPNISISLQDDYREFCKMFALVASSSSSNLKWTGKLILKQKLDYELRRSYQIPLVAFDGVNKKVQSVEILILDDQDTPPYFTRAISSTIDEGIPANISVDYVKAVDGDVSEKRPVRYEIYNTSQTFFRIDSQTGKIYTVFQLDREKPELSIGYIDLPIKAREVINSTTGGLGNDALTTAVERIRINIRDINDNKPEFQPTNYNATIREDIPTGAAIAKLMMTIIDKDMGSFAKYALQLSNYSDRFAVLPSFGEGQVSAAIKINDTSLIDYEAGPKQYKFQVIAKERDTAEKFSGTANIIIDVLDVNDNQPKPVKKKYTGFVKESATNGTGVITIQADDPDTDLFGTAGLRFQLTGSGKNLFKINPISGLVYVDYCATPSKRPCIDFEVENQYNLNVEIRDNNGTGFASIVPLTISILDTNDNSPKFSSAEYIGRINETKLAPYPDVIIQASDVDTVGGPLRYFILSQEVPALFTVNTISGKITATRSVQIHHMGSDGFITMNVQATDGTLIANATVKIEVLDTNDFSPKFNETNYTKCIKENLGGDKFIINVYATDGDSPNTDNGRFTYSIASGAKGSFVINSLTGEIRSTTGAVFNYGTDKNYELKIVARDRGQPSRFGKATVSICINDVNDRDPYFNPRIIRVNVFENVGIGFVVTNLTAKDPDQTAQLKYYFSGNATAITANGVKVNASEYNFASLFVINENNGSLSTARLLDRDKAILVEYVVNVVDTFPTTKQTGTGTIIINILDYNRLTPEFILPWTVRNPYYNITIDEEMALDSYVTVLNAKDKDGSIEEYSITVDRFNFFKIAPKTGIVTIKNKIDYEKVRETSFTAIAWDNVEPKKTATAIVNVTIRNINDITPTFKKHLYDVEIPENTVGNFSVMSVSAVDSDIGDYGVVRYSLDSTQEFSIDPVNGEIKVKSGAKLDRETRSEIILRVKAYDSPLNANVRRRSAVPVYIRLEDVNDNAPKFLKRAYYAKLIETIPIKSRIIDVSATDADIGINGDVVYTKSGDAKGYFDVSKNGAVSVASSLLKKVGIYKFTVSARDENGNGPLNHTDYANVTIEVIEGSNTGPVWGIPAADNMTISVLESQYLGMFVYEVSAKDVDQGKNGIVDYGFYVNGKHQTKTPEFMINPITGVIRAETVYDRETVDRYVLMLVARDHARPFMETTRFLTVAILDVNDNVPEFPVRNGKIVPYLFRVSEGALANYYIGTVKAIDRDLAQYARVYYYIIAGNENDTFRINANNGKLYLAKPVDRERISSYILDIQATNNISDYSVLYRRRKRSTDASITTVNIQVSDINDESPKFTKDEYHECISATDPLLKNVLVVVAEDKDSPASTTLIYSITKTTKNNNEKLQETVFQIDTERGIIRNSVLMSKYDGETFKVFLKASDGQAGSKDAISTALIFVTNPDQRMKLVATQPASDIRFFREQIKSLLAKDTGSSFVCIADVKEHVLSDGKLNTHWSDIHFYLVKQEGSLYKVEESDTALEKLQASMKANEPKYSGLYIKNIEISKERRAEADRISVLVIMILIIIFIILAILLFCIACFCIARSKRRLLKKANYATRDFESYPVKPVHPEPIYDNSKPIAEPFAVHRQSVELVPEPEVTDTEMPIYSVVKKNYIPQPIDQFDASQEPEIVSEFVPGEEINPEPVFETELVSAPGSHPVSIVDSLTLSPDSRPSSQFSQPTPLDSRPTSLLSQLPPPPPSDLDPEPYIEAELDPEPYIKTELNPDSEPFTNALPFPGLPSEQLDVFIEDSPFSSPAGSHASSGRSSPAPSDEDSGNEYVITTELK